MQQDSNGAAKDFTVLSYMLKYVYLNLETKRKDLQASMEQLSKVIQENIHKISQGAPISIPEIPPKTIEELAKDTTECQKFEVAIVSLSFY